MKQELMPFDLDKALAGDKVVTRDGREISQIFKLSVIPIEKLVVVIEGRDYKYNLLGIWEGDISDDACNILFMAPKEPVVYCTHYMNVYESGIQMTHSSMENCKMAAINKPYDPIAIQETKIYNNGDLEISIVHKY